MQSSAILRGIIDIQSEEISRLMTLVEHLTGCLEQSQYREKAALQRCSELEIAATSQVTTASWRSSEDIPPASSSSAVSKLALDSPVATERGETLAPVFWPLNHAPNSNCLF
jgi:hypothetical protein